MTPTEYQQALALAERYLKARVSFYDYVKEIALARPNYVDGAHIRTICDTIQAFLSSDKQGLVITTPPRHMKSTICSECLPAWLISNNRQFEVMITSYNQSQARKMARSCRRIFDEPWHRRAYPGQVFALDTTDEFMLDGKKNGRPNLIAAGVGAGLTGSGADLAIVDDPLKDALDASSSLIKDNIYEWYKSVLVTRLSPGAKVLIVMTRWAYDDLVGRVLQDDPDQWDVLHLPAIDDEGNALWPERFDVKTLLDRKRSVGSRVFEALYQGRPSPAEGGMFKRQWFNIAEHPLPPDAVRCRYWDRAATENGGDYTAGVLIAMKDGQYCIEDVIHIQANPAEVERTISATARMDGPNVSIRMETEPGSSGVTVVDHYARHILQGFDFRGDRPTGEKGVRALPYSAALENGLVSIVRSQWNTDFIDEHCQFPYGAHDDQVDASSGAFNALSVLCNEEIFFF